MIKYILFDMGNVLIDYSPYYLASNYTNDIEEIEFLVKSVFLSEEWHKMDHGLMSVADAIDTINHRMPEKFQATVKNIIESWFEHITFNLQVCQLAEDLYKRGYTLVLCTNASLQFYKYYQRIPSIDKFKHLFVSADMKKIKPFPEYYKEVLSELQCKASACLFIDDSLANIQTAIQEGMFGYWFNGNTERLRQYLVNTGIL